MSIGPEGPPTIGLRTFCPAASQGVHDLDPVAGLQDLRAVPSARHDFAVQLDRDPASGQSLFPQQFGQGGALARAAGLPVQQDFHAGKCRVHAAPRQSGRGLSMRRLRETIAAHAGAYRPRKHPWEGK
jgi:hypothetical protein